MRILLLSFYFTPDLSAGSFRTAALVNEMAPMLPPGATIDVLTTCPNRYKSFERPVELEERRGPVLVRRIPVPTHKSGLVDQSKTFVAYARGVHAHARGQRYDLVYATSSRLMTAMLGARVSRGGAIPLYLDVRDLFVDTVTDVFRGRAATLLPALSLAEKYTMRSARRINLVSRGFEDYFRTRYPKTPLDFFTNGIDDEFLAADWRRTSPRAGRVKVLYAGNIGQGQGLHAVLPKLAATTADTHEYVVVGDGGARKLLEDAIARDGGRGTISLAPPVGRDALIGLYRDADVLMLHLNDLAAFEKVLPSKLFEYAATGRPVLAGVAGHARSFVEREIPNARTFRPCDVDGAVEALKALSLEPTNRATFIEKYRRTNIMRALAASVLAAGGIAPRHAGVAIHA